MITGVHFLLTYNCNYECDHCFLFCGPHAAGTFTIGQIRRVLEDLRNIGTIESVYFEGGEPFLYYPVMLEGLRIAGEMGLQTGVVTNCYWASSAEDAELWLEPFKKLGIDDLSVSDDAFHSEKGRVSPASIAHTAAKKLGLPVCSICIEDPATADGKNVPGEPVTGNGALLKGRAAEKLVQGLPLLPSHEFTACNDEELRAPQRVHVDPFGWVHICQGIVIGNLWQTPLSVLEKEYDATKHPICGPLLEGGPAELARKYHIPLEEQYASACHCCYLVRRDIIDSFPEQLAPRQVYGLE